MRFLLTVIFATLATAAAVPDPAAAPVAAPALVGCITCGNCCGDSRAIFSRTTMNCFEVGIVEEEEEEQEERGSEKRLV
ncbi:hypothetical protein CFE70_008549 [Pyrenophora teres f. teres 0-1]